MESRSALLLYRRLFLALLCALLLAIVFPAYRALAAQLPEEQTEPETVARDPAEIEAEPGINALGESIDYYAIASAAIDAYQYESLSAKMESEAMETLETEEETVPSVMDLWEADSELTEVNAPAAGFALLAASNSYTMPKAQSYNITLDGVDYYVFFPSGQKLEMTDEGYPYNPSASNIVGIISNSLDGVDLRSYNNTVTFTPAFTASGNNNAYRYGSRIYITRYYTSGNNLYNDVTYIANAHVNDEPGAGYGFSSFEIVVFAALIFIVAALVLRGARK